DGVSERFLWRLGVGGDAPLALVGEGRAAVLLHLSALASLLEPQGDADGVPNFAADQFSLVVSNLAALVETLFDYFPAPADAGRSEHLGGALDHVLATDRRDLLAVDFCRLGCCRVGLFDLAPDRHVLA